MASVKDQLTHVARSIHALKRHIDAIRTTRDDDRFFFEAIESRQKTIATLQKEIADLEHQRDFADDIIEDLKAQIADLKKRETALLNHAKIELLIRLTKQYEELTTVKEMCEVEHWYGDEKWRRCEGDPVDVIILDQKPTSVCQDCLDHVKIEEEGGPPHHYRGVVRQRWITEHE